MNSLIIFFLFLLDYFWKKKKEKKKKNALDLPLADFAAAVDDIPLSLVLCMSSGLIKY